MSPAAQLRTVPIMTVPLCPVVLQLLAAEPRDAAAVARELSLTSARHYPADTTHGNVRRFFKGRIAELQALGGR